MKHDIMGEEVQLTDEIAGRMGFVNLDAMLFWRAHQVRDFQTLELLVAKLVVEIANLREKVKSLENQT